MPNQINAKDRIFHTDKGSNPRPSIYIDENNLALTTRQVIVFFEVAIVDANSVAASDFSVTARFR